MRLIRTFLAVAFLAITAAPAQACNVFFKIDGESEKFDYAHITDFVRTKIRSNVSPTQNDFDRYKVVVGRDCGPGEEDKTLSAKITLQKNNIYIKELNDVPLCSEKNTPDGYRCEKGKYNFVDYKGGADIAINEGSISRAISVISPVSTIANLEEANNDGDAKQKMHNAIRLLAMLLAESARFDYVLDDIDCIKNNANSINFMDYWVLVHNWGTITSRVKKTVPEMISPTSKQGIGNLFVPVTREMVPFFNNSLVVNPPPSDQMTSDGKNKPVPLRERACNTSSSQILTADPAQIERDEILSLAAMAMVEKDWQTSPNGRGHNIGSILVDKLNRPVFWARNSIRERNNSTQHGEVRLIENFLNCPGVDKYADGYTVYTTLEPCAMCTGMLAMTKIKRVVYLQQDPAYGHVGGALKMINYPRKYEEYTPINLSQKMEVERNYELFLKTGNNSITDFLLSDEAHKTFSSARNSLENYQVKYQENAGILVSARDFLNGVGPEKYDSEMLRNCPAITIH